MNFNYFLQVKAFKWHPLSLLSSFRSRRGVRMAGKGRMMNYALDHVLGRGLLVLRIKNMLCSYFFPLWSLGCGQPKPHPSMGHIEEISCLPGLIPLFYFKRKMAVWNTLMTSFSPLFSSPLAHLASSSLTLPSRVARWEAVCCRNLRCSVLQLHLISLQGGGGAGSTWRMTPRTADLRPASPRFS